MPFGHPMYATLNRFADGELSAKRQRRVADHLAECARCRQQVTFIRAAGDLARSLEAPLAPPEILDRVLERRAAGERVLLPLESPGRRSRTGWRTAAKVAGLALLLAIGSFVSANLLEADRTGLRIAPDRPRAGDTLTVTYDGGFRFAEENQLRLRARFRTASGQHWQQIAAILDRGEEHRFVASVPLPDSVVYAAFAVESLQGDQVDSRNRQLWDIVVFGTDGRPSLAGLHERFTDLFGRDRVVAHRVARKTTDLYPGSARGWADRASVELSGAPSDSMREAHSRQLALLERALTESPPADPAELAHMARYAMMLGELASVDYWAREAERRGVRAATLYQVEATRIRLSRPRPEDALGRLEALWQESPAPLPALADAGWWFALKARDWTGIETWLPRVRLTRGTSGSDWLLQQLVDEFPAEQVLGWALNEGRDVLLGEGGHRPLVRSAPRHARLLTEARQGLLAELAQLAAGAGRADVARELAAEALPMAWETSALETIGGVLLETGDTASALAAFARVAADPVGGTVPAFTLRTPDWPERVARAKRELDRYVLEDAVIRYPEGIEPANEVGVTAFVWSCAPDEFRRLNRFAESFPDVAFVGYAAPGLGRSPEELRDCGLEIPIRVDPKAAAREAFGATGSRAYFITDASGRIRFEYSRLAEVPRQLDALLWTGEPGLADD